MNHLCIVTDAWHPQVNGVVTTLDQMIKRAGPRGFNVTVIQPGTFKTVATPGYPEIRLAWDAWNLAAQVPANVDAVHIATEGPLGIAARVLCARRGWRYTTGYHTNFPEYLEHRTSVPARFFYPTFRRLHQGAAAVLTPSTATAARLAQDLRLSNAVVWGRGYDADIFQPPSARSTAGSRLKLLYVGRVSIEKNLEDLLKLSASAEFEVHIVGDGPDRDKLEAAYPLARFHGYRRGAELATFYQQADVFVFPSRTDTFGIVMVEAMACGTPVAAYPVEGPIEAVTPGIGGELDADLVTAILAAAKLPRERVLENARRHSWESSADVFFGSLVDTLGCHFSPYRLLGTRSLPQGPGVV